MLSDDLQVLGYLLPLTQYDLYPLRNNLLLWWKQQTFLNTEVTEHHQFFGCLKKLKADSCLDLVCFGNKLHHPPSTPMIYSHSRWVGGFSKVHRHRRDPLSPLRIRNVGLMGISHHEATFQSTRTQHTCRAAGVSCLHHASLGTGTEMEINQII